MTRLTEVDKTWIQDAIKQHSNENISSIIQAAVSEAIAPLSEKISQLTAALDEKNAAITELGDHIKDLEAKLIESTKRNLLLHSERQTSIDVKTDESEQYSRKACLRIDGIPCSEGETRESLRAALMDQLSTHGAEIEHTDIFRMHRTGKPYNFNSFKKHMNNINQGNTSFTPYNIDPESQTQTQQVIIRFTNWDARARVYQLHYNKGIKLGVKCDMTNMRRDILGLARQHLSENQLDGYVYNDAECRMVLKNSSSNRRSTFTTFAAFKDLAADLSPAPTRRTQHTRHNATAIPQAASYRNAVNTTTTHAWLARAVNIKLNPEVVNDPSFTDVRRGSIFGNPFKVGVNCANRNECLQRYENYVMNSYDIIKNLPNLRGRLLGCTCLPLSCHAQTLANIVNNWDY